MICYIQVLSYIPTEILIDRAPGKQTCSNEMVIF